MPRHDWTQREISRLAAISARTSRKKGGYTQITREYNDGRASGEPERTQKAIKRICTKHQILYEDREKPTNQSDILDCWLTGKH